VTKRRRIGHLPGAAVACFCAKKSAGLGGGVFENILGPKMKKINR